MTVEIEWLVVIHGEPIGRARTAVEALELAASWERHLERAVSWRVSHERLQLPPALKRMLGATQVWSRSLSCLLRTQPCATRSRRT